jgi:homoserine kinase
VRTIARAFSPASIGNVAVGFDILGQSLLGPGDTATVRRIDEPTVRIAAIRGVVTELPREAINNTAGRALQSLREALRLPFGFELELDKGIALGSGLGGSAASAVAAVVAANALLDAPLPREGLYPHALAGELVAAGSAHGDNVGPQLIGGLVLAAHNRLVKIPAPRGVTCVVVHPHFVLETRRAREALQGAYSLGDFVPQSEHLALVLAGCFQNDASLIRQGLSDVLIEPRRAALIPGFAAVKAAALAGKAMGASISGAGPSVFAWFENDAPVKATAEAMQAAFRAAGLDSDLIVSPVDGPRAELVD